MPVTTIVTGSFTADHQKPYGVRRHGHDWHVRVSFEATGHKDEPQRWLDETLAVFDHGFLDEHLEDPSNEGVAKWLGEHRGGETKAPARVGNGKYPALAAAPGSYVKARAPQ